MVSKFRQIVESLLDETLDKVNLVLKNPNIVKAIQEKIDNDYTINKKISPKDLLLYFDDALDNNRYIPWVTKRYISNDFVANQIDEINNLLNRFVQNLHKIENKDIGFYKSIDELKDVIRTAENTDLSNNEKARIAKTEAKKVYEDNDLVIIVPETEAAAIQYGKGTKWCTSALNDNRFEVYDGISPLYININKHNGNKYQFWEGENGIEFRNAANDPVDLFDTLLKPYPNLAKYYYEIFKRGFPLNLDSSYIPIIKGALYHKIASPEEISQFLYDQFKKYNYPDAIEPFIKYMSKEHLNKLGMKIQESKFRKTSRFRQIVEKAIKEAKQVGLLYHATDLINVPSILKQDYLWAVRDIGISTSRNLNAFLRGTDYYTSREACLVLDGNKISEHYRVLPFKYPLEDDTAETLIVTNKDLNDEKYEYPVSSIDKYHNWLKRFLDPNRDDYDIYSDEHEAMGAGSRLYDLHKYLVKILIKRSAIEITDKTKDPESVEEYQKIFNEIKDLSTVPVEIIDE